MPVLLLALLLLLDASGSVRTEVNDIRLAALSLLAEIGPRDQVVVMRFNDRVEFTQDWPADKLQLQRALLQMPATGNTKFFNALYDAALKLRERKGRRAIVLFTDGVDTYEGKDRRSPEEAVNALLASETTVHVISKTRAVREVIRGARSPWILRPMDAADPYLRSYLLALDRAEDWLIRLSERTGGSIHFPIEQSELRDVYIRIAQELSCQYVLHYTPGNRMRDGTHRRIRVATGNPDYLAYAREGYYAPRPTFVVPWSFYILIMPQRCW
ncbi:MAG: VWA domain-containing protein [Acidobacteria bacterium]|nr:VWA domain-containing protein [Acidobacteriota bacterium]